MLGANAFPSHTQLYEYSTDNENELVFAGRLSHKLAMQKAQEDVAGADEALAKLQSQLASHEKDKQSKQSVLSSVVFSSTHADINTLPESHTSAIALHSLLPSSRLQQLSSNMQSNRTHFPSSRSTILPHTSTTIPLAQCLPVPHLVLLAHHSIKSLPQPQFRLFMTERPNDSKLYEPL